MSPTWLTRSETMKFEYLPDLALPASNGFLEVSVQLSNERANFLASDGICDIRPVVQSVLKLSCDLSGSFAVSPVIESINQGGIKGFNFFGQLGRVKGLVGLFTIHRQASALSALQLVPVASSLHPGARPIPSTASWRPLPACFVSGWPSQRIVSSLRGRSFDHGLAQAGASCLLVDRVSAGLRFLTPTSAWLLQGYQAPFGS